jgi:hypothetical protein
MAIIDWPRLFYDKTRNLRIPSGDRPFREDSYILLSAGFDGEYGEIEILKEKDSIGEKQLDLF